MKGGKEMNEEGTCPKGRDEEPNEGKARCNQCKKQQQSNFQAQRRVNEKSPQMRTFD